MSFSLSILLAEEHFPMKNMFVTTTIVIVLFTVFFQVKTCRFTIKFLDTFRELGKHTNVIFRAVDSLIECTGETSAVYHFTFLFLFRE